MQKHPHNSHTICIKLCGRIGQYELCFRRKSFYLTLILLHPRYTKYIGGIFIPPVYEVYSGYIVFAFSVCVFVCV